MIQVACFISNGLVELLVIASEVIKKIKRFLLIHSQ